MTNSNEPSESSNHGRVPDPGQLVDVRRRQWIVADVDRSTFGAIERLTGVRDDTSAYLANRTGLSRQGAQHLVTMASIDEDGLGEELEVIWEIEPGAHVIERAGLPSITGQDDSDTLEAFLGVKSCDASGVDISFGHVADRWRYVLWAAVLPTALGAMARPRGGPGPRSPRGDPDVAGDDRHARLCAARR